VVVDVVATAAVVVGTGVDVLVADGVIVATSVVAVVAGTRVDVLVADGVVSSVARPTVAGIVVLVGEGTDDCAGCVVAVAPGATIETNVVDVTVDAGLDDGAVDSDGLDEGAIDSDGLDGSAESGVVTGALDPVVVGAYVGLCASTVYDGGDTAVVVVVPVGGKLVGAGAVGSDSCNPRAVASTDAAATPGAESADAKTSSASVATGMRRDSFDG